MLHATFATPDLTVFCRLDELGLVAVGQCLESDRAVIECRVAEPDPWCRGCGSQGLSRGTDTRLLAHEPFGHRPTTLLVRIRRYKCSGCGRSWREDLTAAAPARAKLSRRGMRWALEGIVVDHLTVSRVAAGLGVSWHTANTAVLAEGKRALIDDPARFDGVAVIGVDEHVWRHTRRGDKYVTVIIDLTPTRTRTGPSRLLAVVEGRSKQAFKTWLEAQTDSFRNRVEIVAMDGFTGYKSAAVEAIDTVTTVMDPYHVVALVGDKLDRCRQRIQQETLGHRGRSGDPLYGIRRVARTRASLLTEKQQHRLAKVLADERHVAFEVTWSIYQDVIDAYQAPDPAEGKKIMTRVIDAIKAGVPAGLDELRSLGQTMKRRRDDILAFFDHPGTSNGPTEAINGLLEHLRGTARGFRSIVNYVARCLLDAGGFRPLIHSLL